MSERVTRSKTKAATSAATTPDGGALVPATVSISENSEDVPIAKVQKRKPVAPEPGDGEESTQDPSEAAHKDKKAKSMAASSEAKSLSVLKIGDIIPDIELVDDTGKTVNILSDQPSCQCLVRTLTERRIQIGHFAWYRERLRSSVLHLPTSKHPR